MKLTIPNILTSTRIPLAFIFIYFILTSRIIGAVVIILLAALTDFLDGFLARKLNIKTKYGKLFDSVVDGIFDGIALVTLSLYGYIGWPITILIILSEILIGTSYYVSKKIKTSYWVKAWGVLIPLLLICALIYPKLYYILKWPIAIYIFYISLLKIYDVIKIKSYRKL